MRDVITHERAVIGAAVAVAAVVGALAVALVASNRDEAAFPQPQFEDGSGIEARAAFSPRIVLFGDTVRAHVDVMVDTTRVDPDSVRIASDFSPWRIVGNPERARRAAGETAHVRSTFVLRCLTSNCVLSGQSARLEFPPARITFTGAGDEPADRSSIDASWPVLLVYSRFATANLAADDEPSAWQADLVSLPAASYRLSPGTLMTVLISGAVLAFFAAAGLAYVAWPRRAPPAPEPEPEPEPEPVLSPLEQALLLLEESVRVNGAADQRRALELVAEELELAEWGDPTLARAARALAWSEDIPPVHETTGLAARVRAALDEKREAEEEEVGSVV